MAANTLSLGIPYLGFLSGRLGDLAGYATMANELIQNADDAKGATSISFDVTDEALIVDNNGTFTDCGEQELGDCPWLGASEIGHRCDFHRFRLTSSHDKANEEDVTGAFGIGFISVYQITDYPEVISCGRHWQLRPEFPENERILVLSDYPENLAGTRFVLPWAFDATSTLRQQPSFEAVTQEKIIDLVETLTGVLASAAIFLKKLQTIELRVDGKIVKQLERIAENDQVLIQDENGNTELWNVFEGEFEPLVRNLKQQYPTKIHPKRNTKVQLAFPESGKNIIGLYHATLPTQATVGLPIHINADFFPYSDRKSLLLDDTYKTIWNKAAIQCAAEVLCNALPALPKCTGPKDIWKLISDAFNMYDEKTVSASGQSAIKNIFWDKLQGCISRYSILYTSTGNWCQLDEARLLYDKREEIACLPVFEQMGMKIVHPELNTYLTVLRKLGVKTLDAFHLAKQFTDLNLTESKSLKESPPWLCSDKSRELLGKEIALLIGRLSPSDRTLAIMQLSNCTLALSADGDLCPPIAIRKAPEDTVLLFDLLSARNHFLDAGNPDGITQLVAEFSVEDAIGLLESILLRDRETIWQEHPDDWIMIIKWLEEHHSRFKSDAVLRDRICNMQIWPSGNQLFILHDLAIPGDFVDPLELTSVIDGHFLQECRRFIMDDLKMQPLTIMTYAIVWVPRAFNDGNEISSEKRQLLIQLLAEKSGELIDSSEALDALAKCPLVLCLDKEYYLPNQAYLSSEGIIDILGPDVHIADWLVYDNPIGIKNLWEWLGVTSQPRSSDVIQRIREIVHNRTPSGEDRKIIQKMFSILGRRWPRPDVIESGINPDDYTTLRSEEWIPVEGDYEKWHLPQKTYAAYQKESFTSQAKFLDIDRNEQGYIRPFIGYLGINILPTTKQVVDHLFHLMRANKPAHSSIYAFLSNNFVDRETKRLHNTHCLYLNEIGYIAAHDSFWGTHPFGKYRHQLGEDQRIYQQFYKEVGVKEVPDSLDAIAVLKQISSAYIQNKNSYDEETQNVVMQCWKLLAEAYSKEQINNQEIREALSNQRVIPNSYGELKPPTWMMFEDRPRLAEKYGDYLKKNVIDKSQGIWEVMRATGVELLSQQIHYTLVKCVNPVPSNEFTEKLRERRDFIIRVVEGQKSQNWDLTILNSLELQQVDELMVQSNVKIDTRESPPFDEYPNAYFDREGLILYFLNGDRVPWDAISREIAYALNPETEASQVAPGIKEVLTAESSNHAKETLDELGIAPLEKAVNLPIPPTPDAKLGTGTELPATPGEEPNPDKISPQPDPTIPDTPPAGPASGGSDVPIPPSNPGAGTPALPPVHKPQTKFATFVYVRQGPSDDYDPDNDVRPEVNREGINAVLKFERQAEPKRMPEDANEMHTNNPGYDIVSRDAEGKIVRYIEVKSSSETWGKRGVALSATQFKQAMELGELFWLYIVENSLSSTPNIVCIQDPARKANHFVYDEGWRTLAEQEKIHRPRSILDIRRKESE